MCYEDAGYDLWVIVLTFLQVLRITKSKSIEKLSIARCWRYTKHCGTGPYMCGCKRICLAEASGTKHTYESLNMVFTNSKGQGFSARKLLNHSLPDAIAMLQRITSSW